MISAHPTGVLRLTIVCLALVALQGCGGSGGSGGGGTPPPPPPAQTVTVSYLRADPAYDGWGLHLWGSAISASVATTWQSPRPFDRIDNGAAVFDVPVANLSGEFNLIAHNGDLKSPIYDLSIVPQTFGTEVWVVQDSVAAVNGNIGVPFDNEADARAALAALGNASASLDLSPVVPSDVDSGVRWAHRDHQLRGVAERRKRSGIEQPNSAASRPKAAISALSQEWPSPRTEPKALRLRPRCRNEKAWASRNKNSKVAWKRKLCGVPEMKK